MAYLITNNRFNPMSFDELLKPLALYKQEYDTAMGAYDQMGQLAGQWEKLGKEDPQSQAYRDYKGYMANLNAAADDLLKNGLNTQVKNRIRGLNQSYKQTITPIEEAWARREAQRGAQQQYLMQNSGSFVERNLLDAETGGIDKFINDTGYTFGNTYKASDLQALAARKFQTLQKELRGINQNGERAFLSDEPGADLHPSMQKMAPYHYSYLVNHGLSSQDVKDWQEGKLKDQALKEALDSIADNIFAETGIGGWEQNGLNNVERAKAMIRGEAVNAIGQTERREFEDKYNMQLALQANEYNNKLRFEREKNGGQNSTIAGRNPLYQDVNIKQIRGKQDIDVILQQLANSGNTKGGRWEYDPNYKPKFIGYNQAGTIDPNFAIYGPNGILPKDYERIEGGFRNKKTNEIINDNDIRTWMQTKDHRFYNQSTQMQIPLSEDIAERIATQYMNSNAVREIKGIDEDGQIIFGKNADFSGVFDAKGKYIGGKAIFTYDAATKTPELHYRGKIYALPRDVFNKNVQTTLDTYDSNYKAANDIIDYNYNGAATGPDAPNDYRIYIINQAKQKLADNDKIAYNELLRLMGVELDDDKLNLTEKQQDWYNY